MSPTYHRAPVADIDPTTLYRILWLRVSVFVVEQNAAYAELDGADIESGAELVWADDAGEVLATLRILRESDAMRIGRVATAAAARGRGIAAQLMTMAVARCEAVMPGAPIEIDAQAQLADWYARFGFAVSGEQFIEDEIPHFPMTRG
ncbi:GNAT family N-acetyltransferase (plasmid) [Coraliomargarita sp. W4R53]